MSQVSNFRFTEEELTLAQDRTFIQIKLEVIRKVSELFGELERVLKNDIAGSGIKFSEGINVSAGKIFRGENYQSFPYVLLDYPRQFNTRSVLAFRTMFWWGNEFSFSLHLQGEEWERYRSSVMQNLNSIPDEGIYCCINESPWQYHFRADNYVPLRELKKNNELMRLEGKQFIKISKKLPIDRHEEVIDFGRATLKQFLSLLK
jgi:hypothetical protein